MKDSESTVWLHLAQLSNSSYSMEACIYGFKIYSVIGYRFFSQMIKGNHQVLVKGQNHGD